MFEQDTRLRELGAKAVLGQMTEEEFTELAQLSKAKQKLRTERAALIADLRDSLRNHGVTIQEIFTPAEIAAALQIGGEGKGLRVTSITKAAKPLNGVRAPVRRERTGLTLLKIARPGAKGKPYRYCKGQMLAPYVPASLKQLDDGNLPANLDRFYTPEGRQYFATDEGRTELAQLVDYIHTRPAQPKR